MKTKKIVLKRKVDPIEKELEDDLNHPKDGCSYEDELGRSLTNCEDRPVTYCSKCSTFYVLDKNENREEISMNPLKDEF